MKKILIMGGNQFVGKEIAKKLMTKKDYEIYVLNRGNRENIKGVNFIKVDRDNLDDMKKVLENLSFEIVIDVSAYTEKQVDILHKAIKNRFKQYIFISSAAVYNETKRGTLNNEESLLGENIAWGAYSKNKVLAEKKLIENSKDSDFKYTIFRPFYIYGIGNNLDRENYFFSRIKYSLPIYVPNRGENLIQFGYIEDLVSAIEMSFENTDFYNQIFNISGDEYITILALVELCGKVMSKEAKIRYVDIKESKLQARDWFPFRDVNLFGDISKIESLGFRNSFSLVKGLEKTYEYNEKNNLITYPILNEVEKSFGN